MLEIDQTDSWRSTSPPRRRGTRSTSPAIRTSTIAGEKRVIENAEISQTVMDAVFRQIDCREDRHRQKNEAGDKQEQSGKAIGRQRSTSPATAAAISRGGRPHRRRAAERRRARTASAAKDPNAASTAGAPREGARPARRSRPRRRAERSRESAAAVLMPGRLARAAARSGAAAFFRPQRSSACRMANGGGGQPGTMTSTGITSATPPAAAKLGPKTPPEIAQAPIATTRFGVGIASPGLQQRGPHRVRDRAGDQQHIGVARRRRDEKAEPVHVVIRIIELPRLAHAGAAGPGIDKPDMQRAAESASQILPARRATSPAIGGPFVTGFPAGSGSRRRRHGSGSNAHSALVDRDPAIFRAIAPVGQSATRLAALRRSRTFAQRTPRRYSRRTRLAAPDRSCCSSRHAGPAAPSLPSRAPTGRTRRSTARSSQG